MAAEAAALLDQLMGAYRDVGPDDNVRQREWSDPEVCKYYLCGFCPSELFTNTKSDVGPCDKVHDESLKKAYEESDRRGRMSYEADFLGYLEKLVKDLDRRISRGRERLRKSAEAKQQTLHGASGPTSERMKQLCSEINRMVLDLERLGAMGCVEEAQSLMKRVEDMERERERERHILSSKTLAGFEVDANDFHEKMELCDVCGSFLVIGDTQSRVDAHLLGKQHLGYARIRTAITELRKAREDMVRTRDEERTKERKERRQSRRSRTPSRERHRSRSRDRRRSRSRDKHRRHSHRSRSRSRGRDRDKDKERTGGRSRDRKEKVRDRDKDREKDGDKERAREKDGDKERSREKDGDKERGREKDGDKERSREKDGDKERSREKDGDKERSREKDREKNRDKDRERERERKRRDKDSDRERSKGKSNEQERRKPSPHGNEGTSEDMERQETEKEDGKMTEVEAGKVA